MSDPEGHAPNPPSKRTLFLWTGAAGVVGALIVLGAVLPAEFNKDPLGVGRLTGLTRLWAPAEREIGGETAVEQLAQFHPRPARTDVIEIPLGYPGGEMGLYALEYKVRMKKGQVLLYDWQAEGLSSPDALAFDFHGHTLADGATPITVATHRQGKGASGHGSLVAPFDGIQGWYFDNGGTSSAVVRVRLHGYYDLVAPGAEGNEVGILANLPAAEVKAKMIAPGRPTR